MRSNAKSIDIYRLIWYMKFFCLIASLASFAPNNDYRIVTISGLQILECTLNPR